MRTYLGYITIFPFVPILILFIFLSYQEWSLTNLPIMYSTSEFPLNR